MTSSSIEHVTKVPDGLFGDYLVYSDTHFGHPRTKIDNTIFSLEKLWSSPWFKNLKTLFIAGDLYDRKLEYGSYEAGSALLHMMRLGDICQKYNISLYILEGTPSHDWRQASILPDIYKEMGYTFEYKYIDTIAVVDIEPIEKRVLFVPDEMGTPEQVYKEVLKLHKGSNFDIAIMHGSFRYQHPKFLAHLCHVEENYLDLVNGLIHAGHIHQHTTYDRIVIQGSWDRYTHGDEGDKGALLVDSNNNWEFIKNTDATIYKTVKIDSNRKESTYRKLKAELANLPIGSHIRVITKKGSVVKEAVVAISAEHPEYNFSIKYDEVSDINVRKSRLLQKREELGIQITPDNLEKLIFAKIRSRDGEISKVDRDKIHNLLSELL